MLPVILSIILFFISTITKAEVMVTPSETYAQTVLIDRETDLIRQHFQINKQPVDVKTITTDLQPRHVWQKFYMLQVKLIAFRRQHGLNAFEPVSIEPVQYLDSRYTWAQSYRMLTEIRIARKLLGITGDINHTLPIITDKKSVDVFNQLNQIEAKWNTMIDDELDDSYTFSQILRLNEDVNVIMRQLKVFDNAVPPAKRLSDTPDESLEQAFLLLEQVQRLQRLAGIDITDLSVFHNKKQVKSSDVFNIVSLTLAELQLVKARIGLTHSMTPPTMFHDNKKPAEVRQLLSYVTNKLALIQHL